MQTQIVLVVLLGAGVLATALGLSRGSLFSMLPWLGSGGTNFLALLAVLSVSLFAGQRILKTRILPTGVVIAVACAAVAGAPWALLLTALILSSSIVLGYLVRGWWTGGEVLFDWIQDLLIGIGMLGTLVGLFAHFPVAYPATYWALLALPFVLARRQLRRIGARLSEDLRSASRELDSNPAISGLVVVIALVHFVVAFWPEAGHDALAMHLFIPAQIAARHQWGFSAETYVWAVMPALGDWIFSIGYVLGGEPASRLLNTAFIFVLAVYVIRLANWLGATQRAGLFAVALFLSAPLTFTESSSLFIESIWASFVVAAVFATARLDETGTDSRSAVVVIGLMTGLACASKAVTLTLLPAMFLYLVVRWRTWWSASHLRHVGLGVLAFLALGATPYLIAFAVTGNPLYPFFNGIFRSPLFPQENFRNDFFTSGWSLDTLYRMTFDSGKYLEASAGAPGFQWLMLLPAAAAGWIVSRSRRGVEMVLLGVIMTILVFHQTSYLRYVFPVSVILGATLCGVGMGASRRIAMGGSVAAGAAIVLNLAFLTAGPFYRDFPLKPLFSEVARREYVQANAPMRTAAEFVNRIVLPPQAVGILGHAQVAGLQVDAIHASWYNLRFDSAIRGAKTINEVAEAFGQYHVNFVLLDSNWGTRETRGLVEGATNSLTEFGPISVRAVGREMRFNKELLQNSDFGRPEGWQMPAGYDGASGTVVTTINALAVQVVAVRGGEQYLNEVRAKCEAGPTQGRVQVNWYDANEKLINASIRLFDCTSDWSDHFQEVTAPLSAAYAYVYATSHGSVPVRFDSVSFRRSDRAGQGR